MHVHATGIKSSNGFECGHILHKGLMGSPGVDRTDGTNSKGSNKVYKQYDKSKIRQTKFQ